MGGDPNMGKFLVRRILLSIMILFFVMFIIYLLEYSLPTSYVETMARTLSSQPGSKSYAEWLADLNAQYGMDRGVLGGFFIWLGNMVRGNFGDSWFYTMPVVQKFNESVWPSFYMGIVSFILQIAIAIPLGVAAARKQYSIMDYSVTVIALVGISLPTFFVATVLKLVFCVWLKWFDISGMHSARLVAEPGTFIYFMDTVKHYVLPVLTLTIIGIGGLMRYTRTNMLEVLNADYIRTARAKGLSEKKVINYHAFRNTLIPLVTILGGTLPGLFSGALVTETLFGFGGIGFASYNSMIAGDIPFTMFYLTFMAVLTLVGNLLADILYAVVDPRVRVN